MDRAEAIRELTQWRDQMKSHGVPNYGKKLTALDLAIEALLADTVHKPDYSYEAGMVRRLKEWQELDKAIQGDAESATTTDCISRQQAIEAFCDDCRGLKPGQCEHWDKCKSQKALRSLPPVTPTDKNAILYICDRKKCNQGECPNPECFHTTDPNHRRREGGSPSIFAEDQDGNLWEK